MLKSLFNKVADLNFTIFIGKHLCWGLFLIKLQAKVTPPHMFSLAHGRIFNNTYLEEHLQTAASAAI